MSNDLGFFSRFQVLLITFASFIASPITTAVLNTMTPTVLYKFLSYIWISAASSRETYREEEAAEIQATDRICTAFSYPEAAGREWRVLEPHLALFDYVWSKSLGRVNVRDNKRTHINLLLLHYNYKILQLKALPYEQGPIISLSISGFP